jgi:hypothetical protein
MKIRLYYKILIDSLNIDWAISSDQWDHNSPFRLHKLQYDLYNSLANKLNNSLANELDPFGKIFENSSIDFYKLLNHTNFENSDLICLISLFKFDLILLNKLTQLLNDSEKRNTAIPISNYISYKIEIVNANDDFSRF